MVCRLLSLALCTVCLAQSKDPRPIVGILTQPQGVELDVWPEDLPPANGNVTTYIAASYVKFAESAGLRVVPIHYDSTDDELRALFQQINGVIFPGGGTNIRQYEGNQFRAAGQLLFDLAVDANSKGDVFPIHGTCLGFQMLTVMAAQNDSVLCSGCFDSMGLPLPLDLTPEAATAKMFTEVSLPMWDAIKTQNITENSHHSGMVPDVWTTNAALRDFFTVLSTNEDRQGKVFVSTIESKKYPITATQWHPEKNNFEWGKVGAMGYDAIPHSAAAVRLSQIMANQFGDMARVSSHRFVDQASEDAALIYNYEPVPDPNNYFMQVYNWMRSPLLLV